MSCEACVILQTVVLHGLLLAFLLNRCFFSDSRGDVRFQQICQMTELLDGHVQSETGQHFVSLAPCSTGSVLSDFSSPDHSCFSPSISRCWEKLELVLFILFPVFLLSVFLFFNWGNVIPIYKLKCTFVFSSIH